MRSLKFWMNSAKPGESTTMGDITIRKEVINRPEGCSTYYVLNRAGESDRYHLAYPMGNTFRVLTIIDNEHGCQRAEAKTLAEAVKMVKQALEVAA